MAGSLIVKKTTRGDSSIELQEEEIAAPPTDIQSAVTASHAKLHAGDHADAGADAFDENDTVRVGKLLTGLTTERYTKALTTENVTPVDLDAIAIAEGEVFDVEVNVVARKADGSERAVYHLEGVFYRNTSGNVTQQGNTASLFIRRSTPSLDVDLVANVGAQTVGINVTGLAADVKWEARIIVTKLEA